MKVRGIESMTLGMLVEQVKNGGRFVVFNWSVGLLIKSVQLPSAVYFVPPGGAASRNGFWRSLATLLTGWWAIPSGPLDTIGCLRENRAGGRDITALVLRTLVRAESLGTEGPATRSRRRPAKSISTPVTSHAA
jgi:hypothetical protein